MCMQTESTKPLSVHLDVLKIHWHLFLVHITPEEFENGGFTLKTHQMFSVHTTLEELKNATINTHFGFVFDVSSLTEITWLSWRHRFQKPLAGKSRDYRDVIVFVKLRFQIVFRPHENEKPAGIRKAPFFLSRDGLVWRVAQTAEKSGVFKFFRRGVWTEPYKAHCICLVSIRNPLKAVEIDHLSSFPLPTSRYLWTYKKKIPGRWKVATNNGLARYSESHEWIGWI